MSVPTTFIRTQQTANGSATSFTFAALVYYASEIQVYGYNPTTGVTTLYVLNTDYTIDPAQLGQPTGVICVFGSAPTSGIIITIARVVPFTQPLTLVEGAGLPSLPVQRQLDELTFQTQQLFDTLSRTPSLPLTTPIGQVIAAKFSNDYVAYDVSSGATPQVSFTPGNHRDSTGGMVWYPTVGGGSLITTLPAPVLVLGTNDTKIYFIGTVDATNGNITALDIRSGTSLPSDTTTEFYQLLANINIVITDGVALVNVLGGGVSGSQNYFYCGLLPATGGSGHILNS